MFLNSNQIKIFPISSPRQTEKGGGRLFYEGKVASLLSSLVDKNQYGNRSFVYDFAQWSDNNNKEFFSVSCFIEGHIVEATIQKSDLDELGFTNDDYVALKLVTRPVDISSDTEKFGEILVDYTDGGDIEGKYTGVELVKLSDNISNFVVIFKKENDEYIVPDESYVKLSERSLTMPTILRIDGKREYR